MLLRRQAGGLLGLKSSYPASAYASSELALGALATTGPANLTAALSTLLDLLHAPVPQTLRRSAASLIQRTKSSLSTAESACVEDSLQDSQLCVLDENPGRQVVIANAFGGDDRPRLTAPKSCPLR